MVAIKGTYLKLIFVCCFASCQMGQKALDVHEMLGHIWTSDRIWRISFDYYLHLPYIIIIFERQIYSINIPFLNNFTKNLEN